LDDGFRSCREPPGKPKCDEKATTTTTTTTNNNNNNTNI
jgi:hypothetical protein